METQSASFLKKAVIILSVFGITAFTTYGAVSNGVFLNSRAYMNRNTAADALLSKYTDGQWAAVLDALITRIKNKATEKAGNPFDIRVYNAYIDSRLASLDKADDEVRIEFKGDDYAFIFQYLYPRLWELKKQDSTNSIINRITSAFSEDTSESGSGVTTTRTIVTTTTGTTASTASSGVGGGTESSAQAENQATSSEPSLRVDKATARIGDTITFTWNTGSNPYSVCYINKRYTASPLKELNSSSGNAGTVTYNQLVDGDNSFYLDCHYTSGSVKATKYVIVTVGTGTSSSSNTQATGAQTGEVVSSADAISNPIVTADKSTYNVGDIVTFTWKADSRLQCIAKEYADWDTRIEKSLKGSEGIIKIVANGNSLVKVRIDCTYWNVKKNSEWAFVTLNKNSANVVTSSNTVFSQSNTINNPVVTADKTYVEEWDIVTFTWKADPNPQLCTATEYIDRNDSFDVKLSGTEGTIRLATNGKITGPLVRITCTYQKSASSSVETKKSELATTYLKNSTMAAASMAASTNTSSSARKVLTAADKTVVKNFVISTLNGSGTDKEKAQKIYDGMIANGIDQQELADAIGMSPADVAAFLAKR